MKLISAWQQQAKANGKTLGGQEIMIKLMKRKDNLGKQVQGLVDDHAADGSETPLEDAAAFFGLNAGRAKGSREVGQANANPTLKDRIVTGAASAGLGLADLAGGVLQADDYLGDKLNAGINSVAGTKLPTNKVKKRTAEKKKAETALSGMRTNAGRDGSDFIRGGTNIAASIPFYLGTGAATLPARVAQQSAIGAGLGAAGYSDDASERLQKVAFGAVGAGAGQLVGEGLAAVAPKVVGKLYNAKKGNLKSQYKEVDELGKKYDVPTSVGDLKGKGIVQNTESHLNRLPVVGNTKFMDKQADATVKASAKVVKKLEDKLTATEFSAIKKIEQSAASGNRNSQRVLSVVNEAGNDPDKVIQAGIEVMKWHKKQIASKLYNNVTKEVEKTGNDVVDITATKTALQKALDEQNASISPNEVVVRETEKMLKNLDDPNRVNNFKGVREFRSKLGNLAEEYGNPTGKADNFASKTFGDIRKVVTDDLDGFANASGGAVQKAYKKADSFYRRNIGGGDKAINKALKTDRPDEIYRQFTQPNRGDNAAILVSNLDAKGKAAYKLRMVETARDKAWNESTESFSPAKFAGEFERLAAPYSKLFKGEEKQQMDGFIKLMRHVERAGQYKMNPPTGVRATDIGITATAIASPTTAVAGAGIAVIAKTLLNTRAGKNLLLAANKLPADKQAALDNILKNAQKLAASAGGKKGRENADRVAGTRIREDSAVLSPTF